MSAQKPNHLQHTIFAVAVFVMAALMTHISWTEEPADIFVFPRLVSVFFIFLATWNLARALLGLARVGEGFRREDVLNIIPGLAIMLCLIYFAASFLGFYVASTLAFLMITTLYSPADFMEGKAWLKRILIAAGFMAVIYILFGVLLKVQTPQGLFF